MRINKDNYYNNIIQDKLGKDHVRQIECIKQEQCCDCKNKKCRLEIVDGTCKNYNNQVNKSKETRC